MRTSIVVLMAAGLLSACVTHDPYSGQNKTSNTARGAGIGAAAGAVIGAATASSDDRARGIVTGALVGAALGGGVGWYMDQQEAALRNKLENTGVRVKRVGDEIRLIMPDNITFNTGAADLKSQFYDTLSSIATVLNEYDRTRVDITGHTDSIGSFEFNQKLSEARAGNVRRYLSSQGITTDRISAFGYGERYPVADNMIASGQSQNRRVEIELRAM